MPKKIPREQQNLSLVQYLAISRLDLGVRFGWEGDWGSAGGEATLIPRGRPEGRRASFLSQGISLC